MSRFTWNDASNGRLINKYIDTMCRDFPSIMRSVAKKGIKGDLGSWFEEENAAKATCGCLVGTTCVVAINKYNHLTDDQKESADAAMILYELIVRKTKRDISKYCVDAYSNYVDDTDRLLPHDPLLVLIYKAGMAAADESELEDASSIVDYDERHAAQAARHKQVVDHIEHRIRVKLNIPYPKRKGK